MINEKFRPHGILYNLQELAGDHINGTGSTIYSSGSGAHSRSRRLAYRVLK